MAFKSSVLSDLGFKSSILSDHGCLKIGSVGSWLFKVRRWFLKFGIVGSWLLIFAIVRFWLLKFSVVGL